MLAHFDPLVQEWFAQRFGSAAISLAGLFYLFVALRPRLVPGAVEDGDLRHAGFGGVRRPDTLARTGPVLGVVGVAGDSFLSVSLLAHVLSPTRPASR